MSFVDRMKLKVGVFPKPKEGADPAVQRVYAMLHELQRPQGLPEGQEEREEVVRASLQEDYPESLWEILQDALWLYGEMLRQDGPEGDPQELARLEASVEVLMENYRSFWKGRRDVPPYFRRHGGKRAEAACVLRWQLQIPVVVTGYVEDPVELTQAWNDECPDLEEVELEQLSQLSALQGVSAVLLSGPHLQKLTQLERQEEAEEQFQGAAEVVSTLEVQLEVQPEPDQLEALQQLLQQQLLPPVGEQFEMEKVGQAAIQAEPTVVPV